MADDLITGFGSSRRSWVATSFGDPGDVFRRTTEEADDEENLRWAALEKLPTYDRMRRGILRQVMGEGGDESGKLTSSEVMLDKLGMQERKALLEKIFKVVEEDNERFLNRLRQRIDRY